MLISDRYEIDKVKQIQEGVFYKAKDIYSGSIVYIRMIYNNSNIDENFIPNLIDESTMILGIESVHIAKILDLGIYESYYYVVSEYFEGINLAEISKDKSLRLQDKMFIFKQIISAMKTCNNLNIYHGSLRLDNILVDKNHNIKIYDLGITKANNGVNTRIRGDLSFICPHQLNINYTDIESDFFNIGTIMYYLIFEEMPFKISKNERRMLNNLDKGIEWSNINITQENKKIVDIIKRLLSRKDKYKNYDQILIDLSDSMYTKVEIKTEENESSQDIKTPITKEIKDKKRNTFIVKITSIFVLIIILSALFLQI